MAQAGSQSTDSPLPAWHAQLDDEVADALAMARRRGQGLTVVMTWHPNQPVAGPKITLYPKGIDSRTK